MTKDITKITDKEFDEGVERIFIALEDTKRNINNKEEIKKSLIIICDCYTIVGTQYGFLQAKFEYYKKLMDIVSERNDELVSQRVNLEMQAPQVENSTIQ